MKRSYISGLLILLALAGPLFGQVRHLSPIQSVTVSLSERGYSPSRFRLRRGTRARITFIRKTDDSCGQQIVIPAYGINRELPLNTPVTVSFVPRHNGTFNFACGMDMLRGSIIVY